MRVTGRHSAGSLLRAATAVAILGFAAYAHAESGAPARFDSAIDGVRTHVEESRAREPVEDAFARLRAEWRAEHPDSPAIESRAGETRLLGQRVGESYRVAQLTHLGGGTTRVVVSTRVLAASRPRSAADVPLAAGSRVIRRLEMAHGPQPVVQVYALALEPPRIAELRFDATARRAGWDPAPIQHRQHATSVRAWRRGADELLVVAMPIGRGTGFLLHLAPHAANGSSP